MFPDKVNQIKQLLNNYKGRNNTMQTCIEQKLDNAYKNYLSYLDEDYYYLLNRQTEKVIKYMSRREKL